MGFMSAESIPPEITQLLKKHGQQHLLAFWEELDGSARRRLLAQLEGLELDWVDEWVSEIVTGGGPEQPRGDIEPAGAYPPIPGNERQRRLYGQAMELGRELISAGKVAAFVVAGGQGTRLGFAGPKGNFPISPIRNKTLFQLFAEQIAAAGKKYGCRCPWYVMTSPLNYSETVEIFRRNGYYGLGQQDVFIFEQGTLPNFSFDGKILMADKSTISCSPDGHGGSLKALYRSGAIADMRKRGVELISYFQVDNPLVKIFDPLFLGLHRLEGASMSSKALPKREPGEKVGVFCVADGRIKVIEYSDLPEDLATKRRADGSLVFGLGSIAIHAIEVEFVERLNQQGFALPLHRAVKKIRHIDDRGNVVEPAEPNGVKLESFVFDALPLAEKSVILETTRQEEFAPVKNADGQDSPATCRAMMVCRAAEWLESAGVFVPRRADNTPDCIIEMAASFAVEKADVAARAGCVPVIKPGDRVYLE